MYSFNEKEKILDIRKIAIPQESERSLLEDQIKSYEKYINETLEKDLEYFCETITEETGIPISFSYDIVDYKNRPNREMIIQQREESKNVNVVFKTRSSTINIEKFLKIPEMNKFGVLNVDGQNKVLLAEMRNLEDITYAKDKLTLQLEKVSLSILIQGKKGVRFLLSDRQRNSPEKMSFDLFIRCYNRLNGLDVDIDELYTNPLLTIKNKTKKLQTSGYLDDIAKIKRIDRYMKKPYSLGRLRDSLNRYLQIDRAMDEILSRDIELPQSKERLLKGTYVDEKVLRELKKNLVNILYIRKKPTMRGLFLQEVVNIKRIPRGSTVTEFIKSKKDFQVYKDDSFLSRDVDCNIIIKEGTPLTDDIIQLLFDIGTERVKVSTTKTVSKYDDKYLYFEQEIIGNNMFQAKYFMSAQFMKNNNINGDRFIYVGESNNPSEINNQEVIDFFTPYDFISLVSLAGAYYSDNDVVRLFNRDLDFIKRVNLFNETASLAFREVTDALIRNNKTKEKLRVSLDRGNVKDLFGFINKNWRTKLLESKLLAHADDVNPIAVLTQARRVVTVAKKQQVSGEMRSLSLAYYGRVCPYETPAGQNIGLMNTLASNVKIDDGIPKTKYYKIAKLSNKRKILYNSPVWLAPEDEYKHKIGDILSLKLYGANNEYFYNNKVMARIKANNSSIESQTIETVDSFDLDYVNCSPEQHLSPTAKLIPFAASDDGARVAFGLNLIRQSVYVVDSDVPIVLTSMYKQLFECGDVYLKRAEKSGEVVEISTNRITVKYDDSDREIDIDIPETKINNNSVTMLNFKKAEGERFEAEEVLVDTAVSKDGYLSPGCNMFTGWMPWEGYNYEDAKVVSEHAASRLISVENNKVEKVINTGIDDATKSGENFTNRYIREGSVITKIEVRNRKDRRKIHFEKMILNHNPGFLYKVTKQRQKHPLEPAVYVADIFSLKKLKDGDKLSGRHGNKGVDAILEKNENMPMFKNGKILDMLENPCGVSSRMNLGQELEGYLGFVGYLLNIRINSESFNGATKEDIQELMRFVYDLTKADSPYDIESKYPNIPKQLFKCAEDNWSVIKDWEDCFEPDGTAYLYMQKTNTWTRTRVNFGVTYVLKIVQQVDHKTHARGGSIEEEYSTLTGKPTRGSSRGGGQSLGEMELVALAAHGVADTLYEAMNTKSDNLLARENLYRDMNLQEPLQNIDMAPRTVQVMTYHHEVLGAMVRADEYPIPTYEDTLNYNKSEETDNKWKEVNSTNWEDY